MKPETLIGAAASVLASPVPEVTASEAEATFRQLWGREGRASTLHSERDRNFKMTTPAGDSFILKFTNAGEDPDVTDFQTKALCHVGRSDPSLAVQRVVPALDGALIVRVAGSASEFWPRVLTDIGPPSVPQPTVTLVLPGGSEWIGLPEWNYLSSSVRSTSSVWGRSRG